MEHYNDMIKLIKENEERNADEISKKDLGLMAIHSVVDHDTFTYNGEGAVTALDFFVAIKIGSQDCFLALRKHGMPFPPFDENGIDHIARYCAANDVDKCDAKVDKAKRSEFIRGHFVGNTTEVLKHPYFPRKVEEWTKKFLAEKENTMTNLPSSYVDMTMYDEAVMALSEFDESYDKKTAAANRNIDQCFSTCQNYMKEIAFECQKQMKEMALNSQQQMMEMALNSQQQIAEVVKAMSENAERLDNMMLLLITQQQLLIAQQQLLITRTQQQEERMGLMSTDASAVANSIV
jgi:hypothetical protein